MTIPSLYRHNFPLHHPAPSPGWVHTTGASVRFHRGVESQNYIMNEVLEFLSHLKSLPTMCQVLLPGYKPGRKRYNRHNPKHEGAHRWEGRATRKST